MVTRINRRTFIQGTAITSVGLAVAACAPKATPAPAAEPAPKGEETTKSEAPAQAPAVAQEKVELIVAYGERDAPPSPTAPAHLRAAERTNTTLRFQTVGGADWPTKRNTLLATGQVPDLMKASPVDVRDFAGPKILTPIMPLVEQYAPNLKRYMEAYPELERWKLDGVLYNVPKVYFNRPKYAPMINLRTDWMDQLGLPLPGNFDELYEVMTELKAAHPDAYWTSRGGIKRMLMLLAYPMGSGLGGWFRGMHVPYFEEEVDGGKWLYGPIHPEFKDALTYCAKAYQDGIMDPDIATTTADQWHEMNSSNKGFFTYDNFTFFTRWLPALREITPDAQWDCAPTLEGARGRRQNDFFSFEGGWCIGANSKAPERVIELLDWLVTPEGINTSNWGIEGEHYVNLCDVPASIEDYTRDGLGKALDPMCREFTEAVLAKYKDEGTRNIDHGVGLDHLNVLTDGGTLRFFQPADDTIERITKLTESDPGLHQEVLIPPFTQDEINRLKEPQANVDAIMNPALDKVVLGTMSMAEFDQAVADAIKAGAQILEDVYNEAEARMRS